MIKGENYDFSLMEWVNGGTLDERLLELQGPVPLPEALCNFKKLVQTIQYLHSELGIAHCDLKPSNILFTQKGMLKIGDFGSAVDVKDRWGWSLDRVQLTPIWSPPSEELCGAKTPEDLFAIDVYSCGKILLVMLLGYTGFEKWIKTVGETTPTVDDLIGLDVTFRNCVKEMIHPDPYQRFKLSEVVELDWFKAIPVCALGTGIKHRHTSELRDTSFDFEVIKPKVPPRPSKKVPHQAHQRFHSSG